jgi:hypothetical protein
VKRPTSDQVIEIVSEIGQNGETVSVAAVVAMIRERTGWKTATAGWRARPFCIYPARRLSLRAPPVAQRSPSVKRLEPVLRGGD